MKIFYDVMKVLFKILLFYLYSSVYSCIYVHLLDPWSMNIPCFCNNTQYIKRDGWKKVKKCTRLWLAVYLTRASQVDGDTTSLLQEFISPYLFSNQKCRRQKSSAVCVPPPNSMMDAWHFGFCQCLWDQLQNCSRTRRTTNKPGSILTN